MTYVAIDEDTQDIIAYFSLLNDKIDREFIASNLWNRLSRRIPNTKRRSSYPALKIGRFAVNGKGQHKGIGRELIFFIQTWFYKDRKSGCRFITVDALREAEPFYAKCGFSRLSEPKDTEERGKEVILGRSGPAARRFAPFPAAAPNRSRTKAAKASKRSLSFAYYVHIDYS